MRKSLGALSIAAGAVTIMAIGGLTAAAAFADDATPRPVPTAGTKGPTAAPVPTAGTKGPTAAPVPTAGTKGPTAAPAPTATTKAAS